MPNRRGSCRRPQQVQFQARVNNHQGVEQAFQLRLADLSIPEQYVFIDDIHREVTIETLCNLLLVHLCGIQGSKKKGTADDTKQQKQHQ